MQWVWFGNLVLVILTLFSVEQIVVKDNAAQTLEEIGLSRQVAEILVEQVPFEALQHITEKESFADANLEGVSLVDVDLSGVNLSGVRLKGADLTYASFVQSDLDGADLRNATLTGAVFNGASLERARLQGAYMHGATFAEATLQSASLWDATADDVDFSNANLWGAYLVGASMQRANFEGASLGEASLYGTNFTDAYTLSGAYFQSTYFDNETLFPSTMEPWGYGGLQEGQLNKSTYFSVNAEHHLVDYLSGGSADSLVNWLKFAPESEVTWFLAAYQNDLSDEIVEQVK